MKFVVSNFDSIYLCRVLQWRCSLKIGSCNPGVEESIATEAPSGHFTKEGFQKHWYFATLADHKIVSLEMMGFITGMISEVHVENLPIPIKLSMQIRFAAFG